MKKLKKKIILYATFFIVLANTFAQQKEILRDTSFTTNSTEKKILKEYPFVKVVEAKLTVDVTAKYDLVYARRGERKLHLDLFLPQKKNNKLLPCVIIFHGGGWKSGNKKMEWPTAIHLAKNGFAAATVEYRLSGEAKYPAAIFDIKEAVRWIRKNSAAFGINQNKIAASGTSAGGELAAFLGVSSTLAEFDSVGQFKNVSSAVQAVIDMDGILDFTHPAESGKDTNAAKPSAGKSWFGYSFKENPQVWIDASPIKYVDKNTAPILFINSSLDRFHAGRDEAIEKLNKLKIYSEVHTIPNTPHPFWLFHPWFDEAMTYMLKFLEKVFNLNN